MLITGGANNRGANNRGANNRGMLITGGLKNRNLQLQRMASGVLRSSFLKTCSAFAVQELHSEARQQQA